MRDAESGGGNRSFIPEGGVVAILLLVAAALRLHRLDAQLWIDEVSALTGSIRRSALEIATSWPGATSHVLYELLAHVSWTAFGESPFSIRLPAVLFGVGGVWAMHRFARVFLPSRYAVGAAALLAFSYIHVFQSQNARGYTALIFFFLIACSELVRARKEGVMARRSGATYLSAGVLAGYSQLFGVVVVPAHLALAAAWWTLTPRWKEPSSKEHPRFPLQQFLPWGLGALLLTGLLYAPFLRSILRFVSERAGLPGEGPRIGIGLLHETLEGLGASLGGPVPLAVAGALGIVGTVVWCRRHFFAFLTVVAPILVQVPVFMALGAGVHPRYFAVALPAVYLVGALGCFAVTEAVACRLLRSQTGVRRVSAAAVALAVALSALPLRDYYRYPKQDFLGAMEYVQRSATPNDQVVGVGPTGRVLGDFYGVDLVTVDELRDLAPVEDRGRTVWVLVTLEGLLEASAAELMLHLRERYERVASFPGTVGDGAVRVYRKEAGIDG